MDEIDQELERVTGYLQNPRSRQLAGVSLAEAQARSIKARLDQLKRNLEKQMTPSMTPSSIMNEGIIDPIGSGPDFITPREGE